MAVIGISRSEFARREGCSQPLVSMAVKAGRLPVLPDGTLDPALVGSAWRASNREQNAARATIEAGRPKRGRPRKNPAPGPDAQTPAGQAPSVNTETRQPYAEALLRKEQSLAAMRELEYREKAGELVDLQVARRLVFEGFQLVRNAWLNWPVKVAPGLAAQLGVETDRLTVALTDLVHRQLAELGEPEMDVGRAA